MATEKRDLGGVAAVEDVYTPEQVQLRLLEALTINLASIAESLDNLSRHLTRDR